MEEQKERIERKVGKTKVKTYIHNFIAYKELLKELVQRDIRIKYRRSFLGMLVCSESSWNDDYYDACFFTCVQSGDR